VTITVTEDEKFEPAHDPQKTAIPKEFNVKDDKYVTDPSTAITRNVLDNDSVPANIMLMVTSVAIDRDGAFEEMPWHPDAAIFLGERDDGMPGGEIRLYRDGTLNFDPTIFTLAPTSAPTGKRTNIIFEYVVSDESATPSSTGTVTITITNDDNFDPRHDSIKTERDGEFVVKDDRFVTDPTMAIVRNVLSNDSVPSNAMLMVTQVAIHRNGAFEDVPWHPDAAIFIGDRDDGTQGGEIRLYRDGTMQFDPAKDPTIRPTAAPTIRYTSVIFQYGIGDDPAIQSTIATVTITITNDSTFDPRHDPSKTEQNGGLVAKDDRYVTSPYTVIARNVLSNDSAPADDMLVVTSVAVDSNGVFEIMPDYPDARIFIGDRDDGTMGGEVRLSADGTLYFDPT